MCVRTMYSILINLILFDWKSLQSYQLHIIRHLKIGKSKPYPFLGMPPPPTLLLEPLFQSLIIHSLKYTPARFNIFYPFSSKETG